MLIWHICGFIPIYGTASIMDQKIVPPIPIRLFSILFSFVIFRIVVSFFYFLCVLLRIDRMENFFFSFTFLAVFWGYFLPFISCWVLRIYNPLLQVLQVYIILRFIFDSIAFAADPCNIYFFNYSSLSSMISDPKRFWSQQLKLWKAELLKWVCWVVLHSDD